MSFRTLVIDTATAACSVALIEDDAVVARAHEVVHRGHAERLLPMIAALPDGGRADHILVDVGPGSFTGIRVGVAAARGLALGWDATVAGYSSMALIGNQMFSACGDDGPFTVVLEGGHGEVFVQTFADEPFKHIDDLASLKPAEAIDRIGNHLAFGPGLKLLPDLSTDQIGGIVLPHAYWARILPAEYMQLPPSPLYGRAPDAKLPTPR